jgi:hypothetical protein
MWRQQVGERRQPAALPAGQPVPSQPPSREPAAVG